MEALAALSLACNVVQLIQFSCQTAHVCMQITENESPAANLADHCKDLQALSAKVQASISAASSVNITASGSSTNPDQHLLSIANQLIKIASDLDTELARCKPENQSSKRRKLMQGLKYQWSGRKKIAQLHEKLKELENTMQSFVLVDVRETVDNLRIKEFAKLDQRTQDFAARLANGCIKTEELIRGESQLTRALIGDEFSKARNDNIQRFDNARMDVAAQSNETRGLIDQRLNALRDVELDKLAQRKVDRLLSSLIHPDTNLRYNAIVPSHESTFEWLYDTHDESNRNIYEHTGNSDKNADIDVNALDKAGKLEHGDRSVEEILTSKCDSLGRYREIFPAWLNSTESLLWINGKPGSGKSTMMKFLVEHPQTRRIIDDQNLSSVIMSHFIWNAGSPFQRSQNGLLSSLLHQVLLHCPKIAHGLLEERPRSLEQRRTHSDWSREVLDNVLFRALSLLQAPGYIFIDGLDEIDYCDGEGLHALLELLDRLRCLPNIKICVASRPEAQIQNRLRGSPSMRLQDLTWNDMYKYTIDVITPEWEKVSMIHPSEDSVNSIVSLILNKADGVFLWVRLVASNIRNGLIKYDDWGTLLQHINALPSKMSELYNDMWHRLNDDAGIYREKAALYLKLLLHMQSRGQALGQITPLLLLLATDRSLQQMFLGGGKGTVSVGLLAQKLYTFERQLLSRCAGLIEINDDILFKHEYVTSWDEMELVNSERSIQFIHRSAQDFLLDTLSGRKLLEQDSTATSELSNNLWIAILIHDVFISRFEDPSSVLEFMSYLKRLLLLQMPDERMHICHTYCINLMLRTLQRIPTISRCSSNITCYAAELGLYQQVAKQLQGAVCADDQSLRQLKSLLLAHASSGLCFHARPLLELYEELDGNLRLILWLLDEGADPNSILPGTRFNGRTPFQCFLEALQWCLHSQLLKDSDLKIFAKEMMQALSRFRDCGANVDASVSGWLFGYPVSPHMTCSPCLYQSDGLYTKNMDGTSVEEDFRLYVEVGGTYLDSLRHLRAIIEATDQKTDLIGQLDKTFCSSHTIDVQAKLMIRFGEAGSINAELFSKVMALDKGSTEALMRFPLENSRLKQSWIRHGPVLDERETLDWMVQNGYLSREWLECEKPTVDIITRGVEIRDSTPFSMRHGWEEVDTSFSSEYSELMGKISEISDKEGRLEEFLQFCRKSY